MKSLKAILLRLFLALHKGCARLGIHLLPVHYYSPVPNLRELEATRSTWAKKSDLPGVDARLDEQVALLREACRPYQAEYRGNPHYAEGVRGHFGPGYGYIEAQALHAMIRHFKPRRIVEVGSGVSTYCMVQACRLNAHDTGAAPRITSIEPYPGPALRALEGIELIVRKVQEVPMEVFAELGENDLLFIDSSHTVKTGSDVNHLILEVLPRLRAGVIVHFHDIYLPYDYQRDVTRSLFHWTESSLLRAFLMFNHRVRILQCQSQLHYDRREVLREVFPDYVPQEDEDGMSSARYGAFASIPGHFPASLYLRML